MKTASQWGKEYNDEYKTLDSEATHKIGDGVVPCEDIHEIIIRRIQLDAFKAGMEYAATGVIVDTHPKHLQRQELESAFDDGCIAKRKVILATAQNLKEIPKV